jgi:hypothetical protein
MLLYFQRMNRKQNSGSGVVIADKVFALNPKGQEYMKVRKAFYRLGFILISALVLAFPLLCAAPEGSVARRDIVSYCVGDATGDGSPELLAIAGRAGKTDTGRICGSCLLVCAASAAGDMESLGYIPPEKIRDFVDLSGISPLKVQIGDVNGDGINEVAICVYKTAKFHPVMAMRPFFFDLVEGCLIPVWLGSRLSRPFDDYILYDIDKDGIDEIISAEQLENGGRVLAVYNWEGFGFEMLTQSEAFDGEIRFDPVGRADETGGISAVYIKGMEQTGIVFRLKDNRLIHSETSVTGG